MPDDLGQDIYSDLFNDNWYWFYSDPTYVMTSQTYY